MKKVLAVLVLILFSAGSAQAQLDDGPYHNSPKEIKVTYRTASGELAVATYALQSLDKSSPKLNASQLADYSKELGGSLVVLEVGALDNLVPDGVAGALLLDNFGQPIHSGLDEFGQGIHLPKD